MSIDGSFTTGIVLQCDDEQKGTTMTLLLTIGVGRWRGAQAEHKSDAEGHEHRIFREHQRYESEWSVVDSKIEIDLES